MIDVASRVLYADLLAEVAARVDDVASYLSQLRPALIDLRQAYRRRGDTPDFTRSDVRAAYCLAYHPGHVAATWWALDIVGADRAGLQREDLTIVHLGAGAGADALGFAQFAARHLPDLRRLHIHLVDREEGWRNSRELTLRHFSSLLPGVEVQRTEHWLDLTDRDALSSLGPTLMSAALVTAQTVLSELAVAEEQETLLQWISGAIGSDTRLLLVELHRVAAGAPALASSLSALQLRRYIDLPATLLIGDPPEPLASGLFANRSDLIPRKKLQMTLQLFAHPGAANDFVRPTIALNPEQRQIAHAFETFLRTSDRRVAILRGQAGTGKTTLVTHLLQAAVRQGLSPHLLAPTGRAARRASEVADWPASTIHSTIYAFDRTEVGEEGNHTTTFGLRPPSGDTAVWIVDEASLIGNTAYGDLAGQTDHSLRFEEGRLLTDLVGYALAAPDSKVVFVGDPHQLPPVGESGRPALDAATLARLTRSTPLVWELAEVTRQAANSPILALARTALAHHPPSVPAGQDDVAELGDVIQSPLLDEVLDGRATLVAFSNLTVASWNRRVRRWAERPDVTPTIGDRLLLTRSAYPLGLLNGEELEVRDIDAQQSVVVDRQMGRSGDRVQATLLPARVSVQSRPVGSVEFQVLLIADLLDGGAPRQRVDEIDRLLLVDLIARAGSKSKDPQQLLHAATDERFNALRATYAYARTGHRAQGSEWNRCIVDFAGAPGGETGASWRYTAMTRARNGLFLTGARRTEAMTTGEMLEHVERELGYHGIRVLKHKSLQFNGLQVEVADSAGATALVDMHCANGIPSRPTVRWAAGALKGTVERVLQQWALRARADLRPLPVGATEWMQRVEEQVRHDPRNLQVTAYALGDYQARVEVAKPDGDQAYVDIQHGADGSLRAVGKPAPLHTDLATFIERTLQGVHLAQHITDEALTHG